MRTPTSAPADKGVTLLEIIIAMLIIGMVAAGIMSAFVFSRRVSWRSGTELSGAGLAKQSVQDLRNAIAGDTAQGLSLAAGLYVDQNMQNPPAGSTRIPALNFPAEFIRFQTDPGTAPTVAGHGDGRLVVVENADENGNSIADEDLDGDGQIGFDFNGDGTTDLRRVRVRVRWSSPES